ncbi:MAG: DUF192 domain-containing protein [Candidatus Limnocylindria bacterium]
MDDRRTDRPSPSRRLVGIVALALTLVGCAVAGATGSASATGSTSATGSASATRSASLDGMPLVLLEAGSEGMRGRTDFDGADGMLFDLGREVDPDAVAFVMDGVASPLDIAWFGADGALIGTASMAPCERTPCPRTVAPGPFRWAIEAPLGRLAGLAPGTRLAFPGG